MGDACTVEWCKCYDVQASRARQGDLAALLSGQTHSIHMMSSGKPLACLAILNRVELEDHFPNWQPATRCT
eukprot:5993610-Pleurochrysis_carterae.AAC.1